MLFDGEKCNSNLQLFANCIVLSGGIECRETPDAKTPPDGMAVSHPVRGSLYLCGNVVQANEICASKQISPSPRTALNR